MRIGRAILVGVIAIATASACDLAGGFVGDIGLLSREYEYEEELYLSLDGLSRMYVNSSVAALNALRGSAFDATPTASIDGDAVRAFFTTGTTRVTRVTFSRRNNRQYVHVRLEVDDLVGLSLARPFAWSTYALDRTDDLVTFHQAVGRAAGGPADATTWTGDELVAFRVHVPSRILYHNTAIGVGRGNILAWEQPLAARLRGEPLSLEARMEPQSILYRTLWLFGATAATVAVAFALVIWQVGRRGARPAGPSTPERTSLERA